MMKLGLSIFISAGLAQKDTMKEIPISVFLENNNDNAGIYYKCHLFLGCLFHKV